MVVQIYEYKDPFLNIIKEYIHFYKNQKQDNALKKAAKFLDKATQKGINIQQIKQDSQKEERKRWQLLKDILQERHRNEKELMDRRKVKQMKSKELMQKKIEYKKIISTQKKLRLS